MHNLVGADTNTLSDGSVMALKMTNGHPAKGSKTARRSIDGLKLVDVDRPLDSSFPEVFRQVLTRSRMLR